MDATVPLINSSISQSEPPGGASSPANHRAAEEDLYHARVIAQTVDLFRANGLMQKPTEPAVPVRLGKLGLQCKIEGVTLIPERLRGREHEPE